MSNIKNNFSSRPGSRTSTLGSQSNPLSVVLNDINLATSPVRYGKGDSSGTSVLIPRKGIYSAARNCVVVSNNRLRIAEHQGLILRTLSLFPSGVVGTVVPRTLQFVTGDPAVVIAMDFDDTYSSFGFFIVARPTITLQGSWELNATVTTNVPVNSGDLVSGAIASFTQALKFRGTALADADNTALIYVPYMIQGNSMSFDGTTVTYSPDTTQGLNVGLSTGSISLSGNNVNIDVYPVLPIPEVQNLALAAARVADNTSAPFHEVMGQMLFESFSNSGKSFF